MGKILATGALALTLAGAYPAYAQHLSRCAPETPPAEQQVEIEPMAESSAVRKYLPPGSLSVKFEESISDLARHSREHELKLGYSVPLFTLKGRSIDAGFDWELKRNESRRSELEVGIDVEDRIGYGIEFIRYYPRKSNALGLVAKKATRHLNLSAIGIYDLTGGEWARIKAKAEVPLKRYHGMTFSAYAKYNLGLSANYRNDYSTGLSVKRSFRLR